MTAKSLQPRRVDEKSGWDHNAKTLSEIIFSLKLYDEIYIEDEDEAMEALDATLTELEKRYDIIEKVK